MPSLATCLRTLAVLSLWAAPALTGTLAHLGLLPPAVAGPLGLVGLLVAGGVVLALDEETERAPTASTLQWLGRA